MQLRLLLRALRNEAVLVGSGQEPDSAEAAQR